MRVSFPVAFPQDFMRTRTSFACASKALDCPMRSEKETTCGWNFSSTARQAGELRTLVMNETFPHVRQSSRVASSSRQTKSS